MSIRSGSDTATFPHRHSSWGEVSPDPTSKAGLGQPLPGQGWSSGHVVAFLSSPISIPLPFIKAQALLGEERLHFNLIAKIIHELIMK